MDTAKSTWFNIFAVREYSKYALDIFIISTSADFTLVFELVSGYGTVGLSLGIPNVRNVLLKLSMHSEYVSGQLLAVWCIPHPVQACDMRGHAAGTTQRPSRCA